VVKKGEKRRCDDEGMEKFLFTGRMGGEKKTKEKRWSGEKGWKVHMTGLPKSGGGVFKMSIGDGVP